MGEAAPVRVRLAQIARSRVRARQVWVSRAVAAVASIAACGAIVDAAAAVREGRVYFPEPQTATVRAVEQVRWQPIVAWIGEDVDGDGSPDFINPTGKGPRRHDAYGYGEFGASRDGGSRRHEGVDFMAEAGQDVLAPISGYVTRIGYAYGGDMTLRYVEIANPALRYEARVFYVDPSVRVGQSVRLGDKLGTSHTLQAKYPAGMTDHVHMELRGPRGQILDAEQVLTANIIGYRPSA